MLKGNKKYKEVLKHPQSGYIFYVPDQAANYHASRWIQAGAQQIYAQSGATKEVLEQSLAEIVSLCNKVDNIKTIKTDIATICTMLQYRMKYPVDDHASIRMGAVLCFMEAEDGTAGENPDKPEMFFEQKKFDLATKYPDLYAFFLTLGVSSFPLYRELFDTLTDTDYFLKRKQTIESMTYGIFNPSSTTTTPDTAPMP